MAAAFILASAFSAFAGVGGLVLAIQVCVVRRAMRRGFLGFGAAFCQLRPELLAELPCFELKQESGDECAVCLEKLETGDCCRRLPACAHVFHARCVDSWLRRSSRCPTCRTSAVAGEKW
ncbi:E3 ubiquitin-protein ligase ATL41-like [Zingiber officinale]|nr:E3 ubiquitin-protein ligase ATL41-like [Zingiber officinale]XP_042405109.1 E3 ubiquitin-protein ligase ATL41-like [Zingiber officinale]